MSLIGTHDDEPSANFATKTLPFHGRNCVIYGDAEDVFFDALSPVVIEGKGPGAYGEFDNFCAKYLQSDYVMIDVGANIGITSLIANHYIPNGKIIAIDASPRNCAFLEKNLVENGLKDAIILLLAVGSEGGESEFNESGAHGYVLTEAIASGRSGITVKVKTIDQIVHELNLTKVDFIKIDVEGYERNVILGASQTIERWNPLFYVEFNSWCQIALHNESPLKFYDFLLDKFAFVYRMRGEEIISLKKGEGLDFLYENILIKGCVEDVIASTSSDRFVESLAHQAGIAQSLLAEGDLLRAERESLVAERDRLVAERDRLAAKVARIKRSAVWRLIKPVRRLGKKLK